ncbi:MAG: glycosyltransferase [Bacteroidales bacterium]|nr:glycosyltransferase [Bacteroidales bacterium]
MSNHLHIVSFTVPYPPDYGGAMDVFYKLKALHAVGLDITLHCFLYDRSEAPELNKFCNKVFYYPRKTGFISQLSFLPYILFSRRSEELLKNLSVDGSPILFEGLHTTYYLNHKTLAERIKIVRAHNIEHNYYYQLYLAEKKTGKKFFFLAEAVKLFFVQKRLHYANLIAAISENDYRYFKRKFLNTFHLDAFHSSEEPDIIAGQGDYLLYHGNLSVPENLKAAIYLIENVFVNISFPVLIAGKNPSSFLISKAKKHKHIRVVASPSITEMRELIRNAQGIIIFSFQSTGTKLKLLESLFYGRHCIVNNLITEDANLISLCEAGNTSEELTDKIKGILQIEFDQAKINKRIKSLDAYSNKAGALLLKEKLIQTGAFQ